MRLIDADKFRKFLQALTNAGAPYESVLDLLDEQPTVYDVDKVLEQIQCGDCETCQLAENCFGMSDGFIEDVRKIIKAGGVE